MTPRIVRALTAPRRGDLLRGLRDSRRPARGDVDLAAALDATYAWLRAAHDAGGGGGVAGWFDTLTGSWAAPYPETTGYIIPTFLGYSEATGDDDRRRRRAPPTIGRARRGVARRPPGSGRLVAQAVVGAGPRRGAHL